MIKGILFFILILIVCKAELEMIKTLFGKIGGSRHIGMQNVLLTKEDYDNDSVVILDVSMAANTKLMIHPLIPCEIKESGETLRNIPLGKTIKYVFVNPQKLHFTCESRNDYAVDSMKWKVNGIILFTSGQLPMKSELNHKNMKVETQEWQIDDC